AGMGGPSNPGQLIGRLPRFHFAGRAASAVATTTQLAHPLSLPAVPVCAALMPGRRRWPHHLQPPFATDYDPMLPAGKAIDGSASGEVKYYDELRAWRIRCAIGPRKRC